MSVRKPRQEIEPRLLSQEQAANYCGLSVGAFTKEFKIRLVKIGRRKMYDRKLLDRELDRRAGLLSSSHEEAMEAARAL